jgi:hypothetical protein
MCLEFILDIGLLEIKPLDTVDPWYSQVVYSCKETTIEENRICSGCAEFCTVRYAMYMLDSLSPKCHPTSSKNVTLFNNLKLLLYHLIPFTFTLLLGHHLLFERWIFTKLRAGKHSTDHVMI